VSSVKNPFLEVLLAWITWFLCE